MNLKEKLQEITSKQPSGWKEKAAYRRANRGWLKKSAWVAVQVLESLRSRGMTQRELAEIMGISAQQVNKIIKGQENLTLETIDKLEQALGIQLMGNAGYRPATAVLDFGEMHAAVKMFAGFMQGMYEQGSVVTNTISLSGVIHGEPGYGQKELHTQYPGPKKKQWFDIHAAQS